MTTPVIDPKIRPASGRNQNSPAGQHGKAEKKGREYVRGEIKLPVRHYKAPPIDPQYDRLLHEIQPRQPRSKGENQRLLAAIEKLMKKGEDDRTSAEDAMLDLLVTLVGEYERRIYPRKKSTPPLDPTQIVPFESLFTVLTLLLRMSAGLDIRVDEPVATSTR